VSFGEQLPMFWETAMLPLAVCYPPVQYLHNTHWLQARLFFLDCLTLTMNVILSFKTMETTCQMAWHHMPDDPKLQQHHQNLKYVKYINLPEDTKDSTPSVCFWVSCVGLCDEACLQQLTHLPRYQCLLVLMK